MRSNFNHVQIDGTTGVSDGILNLSGGVNVYRGDVYIDNMLIKNTSAEDALNIVSSKVDIFELHIKSSNSDGFDCDYCSGLIKNSSFTKIGGDALDFSGSTLDLKDLFIEGVKDKGISVGESSLVSIGDSYINDVGVGIASKDGSKTYVANIKIGRYGSHGVMTYIKKPFYNSQTYLELSDSAVHGNSPYLRQKNTTMVVDGENVGDVDLNVKEMYKSGVMKK